jgi:hypothetical protein
MTITRAQVVSALAELRLNRPRLAADRMIRGYLQRFGNGANTIGELDPALYEAVFTAVGGSVDAQDFYGVTLDVHDADVRRLPRMSSPAGQSRVSSRTTQTKPNSGQAPPAPTRIRTPMTIQLEALLAARAGMPRSKPNYAVNTGNASRVEDQRDDAPQPEYPAGTRMS